MTKKTKWNNQKLRSEALSNMSKDTQLGSHGAVVGVFIFLHEARSLLCDETIQWPRGWLQHGAVTEGADRVKSESQSRSVVSNSLWSHGLYSPWTSPGQNPGVGSLSLLQRIFPTQGLNPGLAHCRWILYQLSHQRSPRKLEWVAYPFSRGSSRPRHQTRVSSITGRFFTNWANEGGPLMGWSGIQNETEQAKLLHSIQPWAFGPRRENAKWHRQLRACDRTSLVRLPHGGEAVRSGLPCFSVW